MKAAILVRSRNRNAGNRDVDLRCGWTWRRSPPVKILVPFRGPHNERRRLALNFVEHPARTRVGGSSGGRGER